MPADRPGGRRMVRLLARRRKLLALQAQAAEATAVARAVEVELDTAVAEGELSMAAAEAAVTNEAGAATGAGVGVGEESMHADGVLRPASSKPEPRHSPPPLAWAQRAAAKGSARTLAAGDPGAAVAAVGPAREVPRRAGERRGAAGRERRRRPAYGAMQWG